MIEPKLDIGAIQNVSFNILGLTINKARQVISHHNMVRDECISIFQTLLSDVVTGEDIQPIGCGSKYCLFLLTLFLYCKMRRKKINNYQIRHETVMGHKVGLVKKRHKPITSRV